MWTAHKVRFAELGGICKLGNGPFFLGFSVLFRAWILVWDKEMIGCTTLNGILLLWMFFLLWLMINKFNPVCKGQNGVWSHLFFRCTLYMVILFVLQVHTGTKHTVVWTRYLYKLIFSQRDFFQRNITCITCIIK